MFLRVWCIKGVDLTHSWLVLCRNGTFLRMSVRVSCFFKCLAYEMVMVLLVRIKGLFYVWNVF